MGSCSISSVCTKKNNKNNNYNNKTRNTNTYMYTPNYIMFNYSIPLLLVEIHVHINYVQ